MTVDPMLIIAQQAETIARLSREVEELRAESKARRGAAAERQRRKRERDMSRDNHATVTQPLIPPQGPPSGSPCTPSTLPPLNPPLNPAHAPAHVGVADVPFAEGPYPLTGPALEAVVPEAAAEGVGSEVSRAAPKPRHTYSAAFEAFWRAYPGDRKDDKPACFKLWKAALATGTTVEELMDGLARWVASEKWAEKDGQYICAPKVWLGRENRRWESYPAPARSSGVVPIATAASSPRETFLAWVHQVTAHTRRPEDKVMFLVERAAKADGVTVDAAVALRVLAERGVDDALVWVQRQAQAGKAQRREVANG